MNAVVHADFEVVGEEPEFFAPVDTDMIGLLLGEQPEIERGCHGDVGMEPGAGLNRL